MADTFRSCSTLGSFCYNDETSWKSDENSLDKNPIIYSILIYDFNVSLTVHSQMDVRLQLSPGAEFFSIKGLFRPIFKHIGPLKI